MAAYESERVRDASAPQLNNKVDEQLQEHIDLYSQGDPTLITERIFELDQEWDINRALTLNSAVTAVVGLALGILVNRKWLALTAITSGFLAQHAIQGWCPPLPLFRRLGYRTRQEIDKEKYALKALRGDFKRIGQDTQKAWKAVQE